MLFFIPALTYILNSLSAKYRVSCAMKTRSYTCPKAKLQVSEIEN